MTTEEQTGFDPRLAWGVEATIELAPSCPVLVVVARGARVAPRPWPDATLRAGPGPGSLSPAALAGVAPGTLVELASPNGATVSLAAAGAGALVLVGCLRNASAVAAAARRLGGPVGVVAAGERRPDGSLRPAVEDLVGAGPWGQAVTRGPGRRGRLPAGRR